MPQTTLTSPSPHSASYQCQLLCDFFSLTVHVISVSPQHRISSPAISPHNKSYIIHTVLHLAVYAEHTCYEINVYQHIFPFSEMASQFDVQQTPTSGRHSRALRSESRNSLGVTDRLKSGFKEVNVQCKWRKSVIADFKVNMQNKCCGSKWSPYNLLKKDCL